MFLGGMVSAATAEKRLSIFRVLKLTLSFGGLKIFQMAQNVNNMQSISLYEKKIQKKLKEEATKVAIQKRKKICEQYTLSAQATTLPFKNLTLGTISSKKSPQMPPNPLQGGLVYGNVTKVSFQNLQIFYISGGGGGGGGGNYTFQKQLFFTKLKKP